MSWVLHTAAPIGGSLLVFYVQNAGGAVHVHQWPVFEWTYNRDVVRFGSVANMQIVLNAGDQIALGANQHIGSAVDWHGSGAMLRVLQ